MATKHDKNNKGSTIRCSTGDELIHRVERLEKKTYFLPSPIVSIVALLFLYLFAIQEIRDYVLGFIL